ncbi:MAG: hypothetical protein ACYTFK_13780 [Planctomycetota bacterium]|jgi:hypothetical protein
MSDKKLKMVIDADSCNGEEQQFCDWMRANHPEIETVYDEMVSGSGGLFDENGECIQDDFWSEYCNS